MNVDDAVVVTGRVVRVCKGGIVNIRLGDGQLLQTAAANVRAAAEPHEAEPHEAEPLQVASTKPARRARPRKAPAH